MKTELSMSQTEPTQPKSINQYDRTTALLLITVGIVLCLTLLGAISGVPLIMMGQTLLQRSGMR